MSSRGDCERETGWPIGWLIDGGLRQDRSPLSCLIFCDLKSIPIYLKKKKKRSRGEKQASFHQDERGGDEDTLTDMSLTVMMTICHQLLTHLAALQSGTQPGAHVHTHPSTVRLGRWIAKICILAASAKLSRWGWWLLPPPLCCSPCFYISICGAPCVKRPGHGKREITWDKPWCHNGHHTPLCLLRFHFPSGHLS